MKRCVISGQKSSWGLGRIVNKTRILNKKEKQNMAVCFLISHSFELASFSFSSTVVFCYLIQMTRKKGSSRSRQVEGLFFFFFSLGPNPKFPRQGLWVTSLGQGLLQCPSSKGATFHSNITCFILDVNFWPFLLTRTKHGK